MGGGSRNMLSKGRALSKQSMRHYTIIRIGHIGNLDNVDDTHSPSIPCAECDTIAGFGTRVNCPSHNGIARSIIHVRRQP